jgi:hypothetical protein
MRPFPDDPQWQHLARKLPPDAVVAALIRFGFRKIDIARRFDVAPGCVTEAARRAGTEMGRRGIYSHRRNGAFSRRRRGGLFPAIAA